MNEREFRKFVLKWMGVSLILHLITAYFSKGYHSADEYFQILEFLNFKLGGTPVKDLAVEFPERMRPWMQPFIYWCLVKAWSALGVVNPFVWAWSIRTFTSLVGWASGLALALRTRDWFASPRAQRFSVRALALIWFFPALHARPSSESLGGSAFLLGLCGVAALTRLRSPESSAYVRSKDAPHPWLWLLSGAALGLSFESRFQMGLMVAGLVCWSIFIARARVRSIALLCLGFLAVFGLGRVVDHWGYGEWVLSPWRYVEYNLLRGEVNRYGQAPVWDVFRMAFTESWPFIGLALAIATLVAWVRHPLHILTWSLVPFFVIHEAIAHKELRFFFPIALAGPVLLTLALSARPKRLLREEGFFDPEQPSRPASPISRGMIRWGWRFLLLNNFLALSILLCVPFSRNVQFYEGVYDLIPKSAQRFEIFYRGRDPYEVLGSPIYFYRAPEIVMTAFSNYDELSQKIGNAHGAPVWIFHPQFELPADAAIIAPSCEAAFRTLPPWIKHFDFGGWLERVNVWTLFRCQAR